MGAFRATRTPGLFKLKTALFHSPALFRGHPAAHGDGKDDAGTTSAVPSFRATM